MRQAIFISILLTNMALGLNRALAGDVPLEPNAFTAVVGDLFRHAIPGSEVTVSGPLSLKIALSKDGNVESHTTYLKSLHDLCVRDPGNCDASVRYHITDIATYYAHKDDNLDPKALRIAVRTSAYMTEARRRWGESALPARPLVGDLWVVGVADLPTTIRMLKPADLQTLNVSAEQALTTGQANTQSELKKSISDLRKAAATDRKMMGFTGDSYMSSLLAFDELWPGIAKSMGGRIIAMAPAPDVLIVAHDDDASAIPDLKKAGREVMSKSLHPLSSSVYRWNEKGWTIAEP